MCQCTNLFREEINRIPKMNKRSPTSNIKKTAENVFLIWHIIEANVYSMLLQIINIKEHTKFDAIHYVGR